VFLHEVAEGAAGRSWGVHVAQLAGVPPATVKRAAALLAALERDGHGAPSALPLFAQGPDPHMPEAPADGLHEALAALDPDKLSPREALEAIYHLKALAAVTMAQPGLLSS